MNSTDVVIIVKMNRRGELSITAPGLDDASAIDALWDAIQLRRRQEEVQRHVDGATGIA
ncbi:hypothetical protein [Corynebacterium oculi]|uniref:hypothetical protein n=1 Tax=Corynebacterium oculi TaxID=1544416 RepID=UPI001364ABCF|nr:hypothetical protein [Corynebacterium oculi]